MAGIELCKTRHNSIKLPDLMHGNIVLPKAVRVDNAELIQEPYARPTHVSVEDKTGIRETAPSYCKSRRGKARLISTRLHEDFFARRSHA